MMRVKRERGVGESSRQRSRGGGGGGADVDGDGEDGVPSPPVEAGGPTRTALRNQYRDLRSDVDGKKGELAQADVESFKEMVDKVEHLHKYARKTREQITDAELLNDMTSEIHDVAKGARVKGGMSAAEFVGAICQYFAMPGDAGSAQRPGIDWEALGLECCKVIRPVAGISTMVGPMDVELKQKKTPVRRTRERPAAKTKPEELEETDADRPSSETDANMATMFRYLSAQKKIEVPRLVYNRLSFAQTVENLFALSFLVKDGRVEILCAEDGGQFANPRNAPSHADRTDGEVCNSQFVFRLDFSCWQLMGKVVPEGSEVMPHRRKETRPTSEPTTSRTPIRKNSRNRARETPVVSSQTEDVDDDSPEGSTKRLKRRLPG